MNITRLNTLNDDKVIVKKEGGGNGGGFDEESSIEYFDLINIDENLAYHLSVFACLVKCGNIILPPAVLLDVGTNLPLVAMAINTSIEINFPQESFKGTIGEFFTSQNMDIEPLRITKEEFYKDPDPVVIIESEGKKLIINADTGEVVSNNGYGVSFDNGKVSKVQGITRTDEWFMLTSSSEIPFPIKEVGNMLISTTDHKMFYTEVNGSSGVVHFTLSFGTLTISIS